MLLKQQDRPKQKSADCYTLLLYSFKLVSWLNRDKKGDKD